MNQKIMALQMILAWAISTAGVDFKVKTVVLDGKRVKLSIWVSQAGYCIIITSSLHHSHVITPGHCRTGTVSHINPQLLQRCPRGYFR